MVHAMPSPPDLIRAELARQERSQNWLARKIGMTEVDMSRRMRGRYTFTPAQLARIAAVLGTPHILDPPQDVA